MYIILVDRQTQTGMQTNKQTAPNRHLGHENLKIELWESKVSVRPPNRQFQTDTSKQTLTQKSYETQSVLKYAFEYKRDWIPWARAGKWYLTDTSREGQNSIRKPIQKKALWSCLFHFSSTLCWKTTPNRHFAKRTKPEYENNYCLGASKGLAETIFLHRLDKNENRHQVGKNL